MKERRALVTGSSSGIGAEIARMLAAEGVRVVIHGRDQARVQAVAREIETAGGQAATALGDLTTDEGITATIEAARQAFGGIDILVNNVGGSASVAHSTWFDASLDEWGESYRHNTLAAVRLIQAFVPGMRERRWGRVIQISSRNAISPHAQFGAYAAAKAALNNLTLSLSKALAGTGVTSNGVMPGLIYTPQLDSWFVEVAQKQVGTAEPRAGQAYVLKNVVHQTVERLGQPRDIAAAVCYLASPLSDFMTGTTLRIDGGATPTVG
ncbi:SDR family NAD(P)-dependent oxidoreductase [Hyalangium versicolor]|uniref:SDR family NAD(P)-dependent oxidoreductase n=1 Tax=Hyalangium versicolor TaxID=2861190 RepID=UPI001CCF6BE0|nr:SDR family NAD(P)-dependent oxidoreductase [Hyalangium versicolor]